VKVEGTRRSGAEVIFEGTTSMERKARAEREGAERGLAMVPPFDHPWIIAGQGTAGLEILEARPDVSAVIVPVGGGGLLAGVATAIKRTNPAVRVIGVEPVGAAKMKASVEAGHAVTLPSTSSIADGLLPVRPGDLTLAHAQAFVDELTTVTDDEIVDAVLWLFREARLVVEPSGAASVAAYVDALRAGRLDRFGRGPVAAVLSGGNIALDTLARLEREAASRPAANP
jgi:threonine dehydratase